MSFWLNSSLLGGQVKKTILIISTPMHSPDYNTVSHETLIDVVKLSEYLEFKIKISNFTILMKKIALFFIFCNFSIISFYLLYLYFYWRKISIIFFNLNVNIFYWIKNINKLSLDENMRNFLLDLNINMFLLD